MVEIKRFNLQNGRIYDDLTGFSYSKLGNICDLLNRVNHRADKNAESKTEYIEKLRSEVKSLNAYLVEKDLAADYIRWKREE